MLMLDLILLGQCQEEPPFYQFYIEYLQIWTQSSITPKLFQICFPVQGCALGQLPASIKVWYFVYLYPDADSFAAMLDLLRNFRCCHPVLFVLANYHDRKKLQTL